MRPSLSHRARDGPKKALKAGKIQLRLVREAHYARCAGHMKLGYSVEYVMCKGAGADPVSVPGGICDSCETIDAGEANGSSPVGVGRSVVTVAGVLNGFTVGLSAECAGSVVEPGSALICAEIRQNSFI